MRHKLEKRKMRHKRVRARIKGTAEQPRLSIFRSNKHIWVQLIDDVAGKTLVAASDLELRPKAKGQKTKEKTVKKEVKEIKVTTAGAGKVGELIAEKALKKKISQAVFDRGGYKYHGLVQALAEGARKGGLKF